MNADVPAPLSPAAKLPRRSPNAAPVAAPAAVPVPPEIYAPIAAPATVPIVRILLDFLRCFSWRARCRSASLRALSRAKAVWILPTPVSAAPKSIPLMAISIYLWLFTAAGRSLIKRGVGRRCRGWRGRGVLAPQHSRYGCGVGLQQRRKEPGVNPEHTEDTFQPC